MELKEFLLQEVVGAPGTQEVNRLHMSEKAEIQWGD